MSGRTFTLALLVTVAAVPAQAKLPEGQALTRDNWTATAGFAPDLAGVAEFKPGVLIMETISNPLLRIGDIAALARLCRASNVSRRGSRRGSRTSSRVSA